MNTFSCRGVICKVFLAQFLVLCWVAPFADSLPQEEEMTLEEALGWLKAPADGVLDYTREPASAEELFQSGLRAYSKIPEKYHEDLKSRIRGLSVYDRGTALRRFAFISKPGDIEWYLSFLPPGQKVDIGVPLALPSAMATMERRGIKEAAETLDKMLEPEFWATRAIEVDPPTTEQRFYTNGNVAYALSMFAMREKHKTKDPQKAEKIAAALDKVKEEDIRWTIASKTDVSGCLRGIPRYAEAVALYDRTIRAEQKAMWEKGKQQQLRNMEIEKAKREAADRKKARRDIRFKTMTMLQNRKSILDLPASPEKKKQLIQEADKVLKDILAPWAANPQDQERRNMLLLNTAGHGFPLFHTLNMEESKDLNGWLAAKPEVAKTLEELVPLARAMLEKERDLEDARVYFFAFESPAEARLPDAARNPKSHCDAIVVFIPLKNADDLKRDHSKFFNPRGGSTLPALVPKDPSTPRKRRSDPEETIPAFTLLYNPEMKQWYWNPPGS